MSERNAHPPRFVDTETTWLLILSPGDPIPARGVVSRDQIVYDDGEPANVLLDPVAAAMLDEQSGTLTSGSEAEGGHRRNGDKFRTAYGDFAGTEREPGALYGDSGGASRFFYCAKTAKRERNAGLPDGMENRHPTVKPINLMRWLVRLVTPPCGLVIDPLRAHARLAARQ